jgi:hypothetical protein
MSDFFGRLVWKSGLRIELKIVAANLVSYADKAGRSIFPGTPAVAGELTLSDRTIQRRVDELVALKIIEPIGEARTVDGQTMRRPWSGRPRGGFHWTVEYQFHKGNLPPAETVTRDHKKGDTKQSPFLEVGTTKRVTAGVATGLSTVTGGSERVTTDDAKGDTRESPDLPGTYDPPRTKNDPPIPDLACSQVSDPPVQTTGAFAPEHINGDSNTENKGSQSRATSSSQHQIEEQLRTNIQGLARMKAQLSSSQPTSSAKAS